MTPEQYILRKHPAIMITNACNMSCGGCLQFCGQFKKKQIFFISIEQFREALDQLSDFRNETLNHKPISIYGGEPTLHPRFEELLEMMYEYRNLHFIVFTNGSWLVKNKQNLKDLRDPITGETVLAFEKVEKPKEEWLYHRRGDLKNNRQTKSERELLADQVNDQKFVCEVCGGVEYSFYAFHKSLRPGYREWQLFPTYYRCKGCESYYKLSHSRLQDHLDCKVAMSDSFKKELDKLPYDPWPEYKNRFNRRVVHSAKKNVGWRIDAKIDSVLRWAYPAAIAPIDFKRGPDYWQEAQENCYLWRNCETMIYDGKGYFCLTAAAMDKLFYDGKYGWELEEGKNPFNRTNEEIAEQASHFCYRCGYALSDDCAQKYAGEKQLVASETITSPTNLPHLKRGRVVSARFIPLL